MNVALEVRKSSGYCHCGNGKNVFVGDCQLKQEPRRHGGGAASGGEYDGGNLAILS